MASGKYDLLKDRLSGMGSVMLAYSGGVDSTLLLAAAKEALGDSVVAVTAYSPSRKKEELDNAKKLASDLGVEHIVIGSRELENEMVSRNTRDRCYHCKKTLFSEIKRIAGQKGVAHVIEGSNADDAGSFRPGAKALRELGIRSPLVEAGLTKEEVRALSREKGLPTWNMPTESCLLTRFPYDVTVDRESLNRVRRAEEVLCRRGFKQARVRVHGGTARIEVPEEHIEKLASPASRDLVKELKGMGFKRVTVDLEGYRTGSMDI